ncbi:MAG: glycosyltransferase [Cytophagaceae bacterium]|jgi:glycosyltransferase involved in cell wall biosynthesis|nr:glycosyltransferase [Cytophagaceae bacterium]
MNILIALSRFPYPTDKGDKLRAYFQIKELAKSHQLYLVCLSDTPVSPQDIAVLQPFCAEIKIIYLTKKEIIKRLLKGIFSPLPFQVHYFNSPEMFQTIETLLRKYPIDLIYVQLIRLLHNIPTTSSVPVYLDYMDALSAGMQKRYSYSMFYEKPLVAIECSRLKKAEQLVAEQYQGFSIISAQDKGFLPEFIQQKVDVIPNGVNQSFLETQPQESKKFDIIFTGNMGYHPNVVAAKFLVTKVLPLLLLKGLSPKICLAGTSPTKEVLQLAGDYVTVTGFVPDIKPFIATSKICVAPLFSGSGLQNKLLEAMACGIPAITTSLANEALGAIDGETIYIANTAEVFASKIEYLLQHDEVAEEIGKEGKKYIESTYRWEAINTHLEKAFEQLVQVK